MALYISSNPIDKIVKQLHDDKTNKKINILIPNTRVQSHIKKVLAENNLGLNVEVETVNSWCNTFYNLYDGSLEEADMTQVRSVLWELLLSKNYDLKPLAGVVSIASNLAMAYSTQLDNTDISSLSHEQKEVVKLCQDATKILADKGFITTSDMFKCCENLIESDEIFIASNFADLDRKTLELFAQAANSANLYWKIDSLPEAAAKATNSALEALRKKCTDVNKIPSETKPAARRRTEEIQEALDSAFSDEHNLLTPGESILLLNASGPEAEAELIARQISKLADSGAEKIIVATSDVKAMWQKLGPKASSRGIQIHASWTNKAADLKPTITFYNFVTQYQSLIEAGKNWPFNPSPDDSKPSAALNNTETIKTQADKLISASLDADRNWWPPRAVLDFLTSSMSGSDVNKVFSMDRRIRSSRSASPSSILKQIDDIASDNECLKLCINNLKEGNIKEAARALIPNTVKSRSFEALKSLQAIESAIEEVEAVSPSLIEDGIDPHILLSMLNAQNVYQSLSRGKFSDSFKCDVEIAAFKDLEGAPTQSVDAVIIADQTSVQNRISRPNNSYSEILHTLKLNSTADDEDLARYRAYSMWSIPTHKLIFERTLHNSNGEKTYPSPMLAKLLSLYNEPDTDESDKVYPTSEVRSENKIAQNLSAKGREQESNETYTTSADENISKESVNLILSRHYVTEAQTEGLTMSATSIEDYMMCPKKWFHERGILSQSIDGALSAAALGTLAHKTLEISYKKMYQGAYSHNQESHEPTEIPLVIENVFYDLVKSGIYGQGDGKDCIPYTVEDKVKLETLLEDIQKTAVYDFDITKSLHGTFKPTEFELEFGNKSNPIKYAGINFTGKIDRVDIDKRGNAVIIDYKYKDGAKHGKDYAQSMEDGIEVWVPKYIQSLIYAQAYAKTHPKAHVVGAIYLLSKSTPIYAGYIEEKFADSYSYFENNLKIIPSPHKFKELSQRCEGMVTEAIRRLSGGDVAPAPKDKTVCTWCPISRGCKGRLQ